MNTVASIKKNRGRITFQISTYYTKLYYPNLKGNKYIYLGLEYSERNLIKASVQLDKLISDLEDGTFKPEAEDKYQCIKLSRVKVIPDLIDLYNKCIHAKLKEGTVHKSTYLTKHKRVEKLLTSSPQDIKDIKSICAYISSLENGLHTKRDLIQQIKSSIRWGIENNVLSEEFNESIQFLRKQEEKYSKSINKTKPTRRTKYHEEKDELTNCFTEEEQEIIIAESYQKFLNPSNNRKEPNPVAYLIEFIFRTGVRPGEAFALTWGDITPDLETITIKSSFCRKLGQVKETKNYKQRRFRTNTKVKELLSKVKPNNPKKDELVFKPMKAEIYDTHLLYKAWLGMKVCGVFYPGIVTELVNKGLVKQYLPPYNMRHTFITIQILKGKSPALISRWTGHDLKTLLRYYESVKGDEEVPAD